MGNVSASMYRDVRAARRSRTQDEKPVSVVRLNKNGQPSRMASDTQRFRTIDEANAYIARIHELNPGRHYEFQITEA